MTDSWGDPLPRRGAAALAHHMECSKGFTLLVSDAASAEGSTMVQAPTTSYLSAFKVENAQEQAIYTLTLPQHPAYPMIVHRVFRKAGRKIVIDMDGCPFGDKTASLALYKQFQDLDAKATGQAATTAPAHGRGRHHPAASQ
jgi:hypothetical protein